MPARVPLQFFRLGGSIVQLFRLRRPHHRIELPVHHEQRTAGQRAHRLERVGHGPNERRERRLVREVAASRERDGARRMILRRDDDPDERTERIADDGHPARIDERMLR